METGWIAFSILAVLDFIVVAAWKPFFAAYMGEKDKRLATKEDIEKVLTEVRLVTSETEAIKATISGDLWRRQAIWTQKRDLYSQILKVIGDLGDVYITITA